VAVVEDNSRTGGAGDAVGSLLREHHIHLPLRTFGIPDEFPDHGKRAQLLADFGLTVEHLEADLLDLVDRAGTRGPAPL
jgi:1-deoxy-D-xylulose-5-phosphate synthase